MGADLLLEAQQHEPIGARVTNEDHRRGFALAVGLDRGDRGHDHVRPLASPAHNGVGCDRVRRLELVATCGGPPWTTGALVDDVDGSQAAKIIIAK